MRGGSGSVALVLVMGLAVAAQATEVMRTEVPAGATPVLDGTLADGEWEGALRVALAPQGEAFLLQDENALYVGIRARSPILPSLALLREGRVLILHASASLGTAEYEQEEEGWVPARPFQWRCRDGRTPPEERERFLAEEGWMATTVGMGRQGEAEYRIDRRLLPDGEARLALVAALMHGGPPVACVWPDTVKDGTTRRELLFGTCPDLSLEPETWSRLALKAAAAAPEGETSRQE